MDCSFVANHLWQSTLFAGAAGLLTLALRRNHARTRHWVWLAASMKFLIPFALLMGLGSQFAWLKPPAVLKPSATIVTQGIPPPFLHRTSAATPEPEPAPRDTRPLASVLLGVWICGVLAVAVRRASGWLEVRATLRGASPLEIGIGVPVMSTGASIEPGVFGIWRPVLLLPHGLGDRLSPHQLQAILAHELCHIRRRDNLAAAIHMVVETIFWFHPLVWWLGARLVEERERACDEEVLCSGSQPQVYAESILEVCKLYLQSPVACVSGVTGAGLRGRIERIMGHRLAQNLSWSRKLLLAAIAVAAVAGPIVVGAIDAPGVRAQGPAAAFEVASIRPSQPGTRGTYVNLPPPGREFTSKNVPLRTVIQVAYHIQDYQLSGGPGWMASDPFDIAAKTEHDATREEFRRMIQALLADRFKLVVRRETKELPVYELMVAKNGSKLPESTEGDGGFRWGGGRINGRMVSMTDFVEVLSVSVGRPVLDRTALKGLYDITLQWTPARFARNSPDFVQQEAPQKSEPGEKNPRPPIDPDGPSIFTAIQEQLGLKLEARKGPVETIVVEHAEKPSEN